MTEGIIIAIIGAVGAVLAAIIAGLFAISKRRTESEHGTGFKQTQKGKNNTQIGVQNNYNSNNTIQFGDTTADDGTIIIDCGNASGGGGIKYEPSQNRSNEGGNTGE